MNFDPLPRKKRKQIGKTGFAVTQILIFQTNRHLSFKKNTIPLRRKRRYREAIFKYNMAPLPWQRAPRSNVCALFCQYFIILVYWICYLCKKKCLNQNFTFLVIYPLNVTLTLILILILALILILTLTNPNYYLNPNPKPNPKVGRVRSLI